MQKLNQNLKINTFEKWKILQLKKNKMYFNTSS